MPDAPDLSKLPCPEGCRWEITLIRPFHGITYSFSLNIGNHPIACVCIGENGDVSHRTGNLWSFVHGFKSVDDAVASALATLGLSPAPAGRTFTEAEVRVLMRGAWRHGFLRGKATYLKKNTPHMPDLMEKDITAAIAAATDAGKDGPQ